MAGKDLSLDFKKKKVKKLIRNGLAGEARNVLLEICRVYPKDYDSFFWLAELSIQQGVLGDAVAAYKHAISLRPSSAEPLLALGQLYRKHRKLQEARPLLFQALQIDSKTVAEYKRLGTDFQQIGALENALSIYEEVLKVTPNDYDVYNNCGVALHNLKRLDEALNCFKSSLDFGGEIAHVYCNMGNVLFDLDALDEARECYRKSLALDSDNVYALASYAKLERHQMNLDEARECLDKAIELNPEFAGAYWNRSQLLLLQGAYKQGWQEYESRLRAPEYIQRFGRRTFSKPRWQGEVLGDKRLFVYSEQGHGDTIQFCRYIPLLKSRARNIVFECREPLFKLMQGLGCNIDLVKARDDYAEPDDYDYQVPLMSLPYVFGTTVDNVPNEVPYLKSDEQLLEQWAQRLCRDGLKVGITWAGNPNFANDRYRSLELHQLNDVLRLPGINFFSLQKGPAEAQLNSLTDDVSVMNLSDELNDFADTAAAIANMDLVITVDTAVAHLAGALGKSVWLFTYTPTEWRWLLDRDDSPWYPTMTLFRQKHAFEWQDVVQEMKGRLVRDDV